MIQYMANVMKTINPITLALLQPPTPVEQAGLDPGSYLTYTATNVTENHAPKAVAMMPPMKETRYTCPYFLETSILKGCQYNVWSAIGVCKLTWSAA